MQVLIYAAGQDTGGQGFRIKRAFDRLCPDIQVHEMHVSPTYIDYPRDLPYDGRVARRLMADSDVLHLRNTVNGIRWLAPTDRPLKILLHHHGSRFRDALTGRTTYEDAVKIGCKQVVSTLDLTLLGADLTWLPAVFDLEELAALRAANGPSRRANRPVRIVQMPTNRTVKSTDLVVRVVQDLQRKHSVKFDLVEGVRWSDALLRKARADIVIDQLKLGYGLNAIEAWAMGIPVIAGVADPAVRQRMVDVIGHLPFYEASEETLGARLLELVVDRELRDHWGQVGLAYVHRFHAPSAVVPLMADLYRSVARQAGGS